jgi:hypothetical protein
VVTKEITDKIVQRLHHEKKQEMMLAACCCAHERLGVASLLRLLDENLLMMIWQALDTTA